MSTENKKEEEKKVTVVEKKTTRRDMLKWTAALAAGAVGLVAGVGGDMILRPTVSGPGVTTTVTETATSPLQTPEKFVFTSCAGAGDHDACNIKTIVADGKIVRTERMVLPEPEGDWPGICAKGLLSCRMPYDPNRLLYPMKRVGKRGEGKFERISWQQAMDEVGAKLREIRDKYGANAVGIETFNCGHAPAVGTYQISAFGFQNLFGATGIGSPAIDSGPFVPHVVDFGESLISMPYFTFPSTGNYDARFLKQSKMIIIWGFNPISNDPGMFARHVLDPKENGTKVVVVGRWYDQTAAMADWFIPVNGGSDAALALGMVNVMINDDIYDSDFMANYTVAPFLVRNDNGMFLRESDIVKGGDQDKYVWWDAVSESVKTMPGHVHKFPQGTSPDLLAAQSVNEIGCKTAFLKLKEHVAEWTPEAQEKITGVPAQTCIDLAHEYVNNRPATIWHEEGIRYYNGTRIGRAITLLSAVSGNLGLKGGRIGLSGNNRGAWPSGINMMPLMFPEGPQNAKGVGLGWNESLECVTIGKPWPIKAIIKNGGNTVHAGPSRQNMEAFFGGVDLFVMGEIRMTDTTNWADYVFPACTTFERYETGPFMNHSQIFLNVPAIEPLGEAKDTTTFWTELAKQVGLEKFYDKTQEQLCQFLVEVTQQSNPPGWEGITWERLKSEQSVRFNVPTELYDPFDIKPSQYPLMDVAFGKGRYVTEGPDFPTPSGRMEFYYEKFADLGEAIARHIDPWHVFKGKARGYPLQFINSRHRFFMQTQFMDDPILKDLATGGKEPLLYINPRDAEPRGIGEGDLVEASNDRGNVKAKAHLSQIFPPGLVNIWYAWRKEHFVEGCPQYLMAPHSVPETRDKLAERALKLSLSGAEPDMIWDQYCEVRKV